MNIQNTESKKIILAFSGGLDTSFSIPYLMERKYEVITVTVDTGGFSEKELKKIAERSKGLGAKKHFQVNGQALMFSKVVSYIIKTNGLYEGSYPNMCADRYIIVEEAIKVAKREKANIIAHGSSSMGNDQVRFDTSITTIAPQMQIVTPIREFGGNRQKEQEYLMEKGFTISALHKKYSVNQNILGVTYSGSEIDKVQEPDESMFVWTKLKKSKPYYLTINFKKGIPISLNEKPLSGPDILKQMNEIVGSYGFGRDYYTGDCVIGIKGHIAFEAPGILALIKAHTALEQLVLTKHQQMAAQKINQHFTDLLYSGKFYEPVMKDLKSFTDSQQETVTGKVTLKLEPHSVQAVAVESPYSLINPKIATYAQGATWSAQDAEGFIKLYGLQDKIAAQVRQKRKEKGVL